MSNKKDIYKGVIPLDKALGSVVFSSSGSKLPRPQTIKEQKYSRLRDWMEGYSKRAVFNDEGNITEVKEKQIFPTEREMRKELDLTLGQMRSIAEQNDDVGIGFSWRNSIDANVKNVMQERLGLQTSVTYVALKSLYPALSNFFEEKK